MYYIEVKGHKYYYLDLADAFTVANGIFEETGIIIGIFSVKE